MNLLAMHRAESGQRPGFWPGSLRAKSCRAWLVVPLCLGLLILAQALVTGCAVGPDYKRPEATTIPDAYSVATVDTNYGWKVAEPRGQLPKGNWWEVFGSPELNDLEAQAAIANQNLKAAVDRFYESRAQLNITRAGLFPSIDAAPSAARERISPNEPSVLTGKPIGATSTFNDFSLPLEFSYEVDAWGSVRRSVEYARDTSQASADDIATLDLGIQAAVASDYFNLRALDTEMAVLQSNILVFNRSLDLVISQRQGGIATDLEVAQAQTVLKTTEAQLPYVGLQRAQFEHALALLVGQPAPTFRIPVHVFKVTPPLIPAGLPSDLLEQRPDISASERTMAAANANIGVAKAAFYPTIILNGLGGLESVNAGSLFNASSHFWSVGPTLTLPIFEGGRLRAGLRLSEATYDEMVANYRQTVLTAFSQVEDSLAAQNLLANQYEAESAALVAARKQVEVANDQYREGLITYLDVATAQNTELGVEFSTVQIRGQQLVAAVSLVQSLGGGWQEPKRN
jgi:multidrug efflux system outer membrane protein